jgi:hypothetical protein
MIKPKIILIIFLLSSCSYGNYDRMQELQLFCSNLKPLYQNRVTKHLRFSLDDYVKYLNKKEFELPKTENVFTSDQLALLKEQFLMLRIVEAPHIHYNSKHVSKSYKMFIANEYTYAYLTILISPKEMRIWRLHLYPVGIIGYDIEKVEEIQLSRKKRKKMEACRSAENMQYWI